jgi:hypothetical protein
MGWNVSNGFLTKRRGYVNLPSSTPTPILGKEGETLVLLAGKPRDPTYEDTLRDLEGVVTDAGKRFYFSERQRYNRRGDYLAISTGISFGCGSTVSSSIQGRRVGQLTVVKRLRDL